MKSKEVAISEQLNLTVSLRGTREVRKNCQIFHLLGQLDAFSEPTFQKVILSYVKEGANQIILDLSQIDFIDSSGLGALVRIVKAIEPIKGKLQIVTNPRVTQTVKMVRLEKFLNLRNSLDEALADIS
ncbi:STAS domain-containing protein [Cyanobacterium stanieri LEGE 03274]|uniref:Anti-sigma factor antagonist n=1 Tax=Cyanobacterium stanieri LEGE 03274 TaxID=1828756 RepID=A0ABR9V574_9CHRO|nr:STAS domain-containing protein [Cyanobacterium stanieri LEGE 03274]